ncbi:hypothetical protein CBM2633_U30025 [Cupriavidus taiwanensis]|nr:hypothetical protein CBM2633_U30025 [Cupriavidus taiwanensis]
MKPCFKSRSLWLGARGVAGRFDMALEKLVSSRFSLAQGGLVRQGVAFG